MLSLCTILTYILHTYTQNRIIMKTSHKDIVDKLIIGNKQSQETNNKANNLKPNDEKAQEAYQLLKKYYLLSARERELLATITECDTFIFSLYKPRDREDFNKTPINYEGLLQQEITNRTKQGRPTQVLQDQLNYLRAHPVVPVPGASTNSFTRLANAYNDSLDKEITRINQYNALDWYEKNWRHWVLPKSTEHLKIAKEYVSYHADARQYLIHAHHTLTNPENPDAVTQQLRPAERPFLDKIKDLWKGLWGTNKQLSDLSIAHVQKTTAYEKKLADVELDVNHIAKKVYEDTSSGIVTHLVKVGTKEVPTSALIHMYDINSGPKQKKYMDLVQITQLPSYLQNDIDSINSFIKLRRALIQINAAITVSNPNAISITNSIISTRGIALKAIEEVQTRLETMKKNAGKAFPDNLQNLSSELVKIEGMLNNLTANTTTADPTVAQSSSSSSTITKNPEQALKQLAQQFVLIESIFSKLTIVNITPTSFTTVPTDLDKEPQYIKDYRIQQSKWKLSGFVEMMSEEIPALGELTPKRGAKGMALIDRTLKYARDEFANSMVNSLRDYRDSILKKYEFNEPRDKKRPASIIDRLSTFLPNLNEIIKANRVICAADLRSFLTVAKDNVNEENLSPLQNIGKAAVATGQQFGLIRQDVAAQIDYLDVYIKNLSHYLTLLKTSDDEAVSTVINRFIFEVYPPVVISSGSNAAAKTLDDHLENYITELKKERDFMNDVLGEALKVKQAAKLISSQLSYKVNPGEQEAAKKRTR